MKIIRIKKTQKTCIIQILCAMWSDSKTGLTVTLILLTLFPKEVLPFEFFYFLNIQIDAYHPLSYTFHFPLIHRKYYYLGLLFNNMQLVVVLFVLICTNSIRVWNLHHFEIQYFTGSPFPSVTNAAYFNLKKYLMFAFLFLICYYNMCYHLGSDNIVVCFHCGIEMTLDFHEDLTEKHRQLSPNCRFLRYEMQKMNEDVATIRRQLLCKVCLDDRVKMTFRPCGHLATCEHCALLLESCPICRTKITEKIKTFLWSNMLKNDSEVLNSDYLVLP